MNNTIVRLKNLAAAAWSADDGQSTVQDIAAAVVRRAVRDGVVTADNADAAVAVVIAHLDAQLSAPVPPAPVDPVEAEEARLRAEWDAAVQAGSVWMTVYDEDGGTSRVCRPPRGWTHEGCETLGQYLRAKGAGYAAKQDAAHNAAGEEFRAWWSVAQGRPLEEQRAGWDRLSRAAKLCAVGVVPKSLRRLLS
jgi:hypothetical protein